MRETLFLYGKVSVCEQWIKVWAFTLIMLRMWTNLKGPGCFHSTSSLEAFFAEYLVSSVIILNFASHWKQTSQTTDSSKPVFFSLISLDASGCRSVWPDPAQLLWPGQDGLHDGVCSWNGCWRHVWHFLLSQVTQYLVYTQTILYYINNNSICETVCSVSRVGMRGRELMGGVGKTMMQSGGTFGTFMAIGMGIRCWGARGTTSSTSIQLFSYGTFLISTSALCLFQLAV